MGDLLDETRLGRGSVRENLARSIAAGQLTQRPDTSLTLSLGKNSTPYLYNPLPRHRDCLFLDHFLFRLAYDRRCVPDGCRACYKVRVEPRTLVELVAVRELLEQLPYSGKCGIDLLNPYSRSAYGGYLYCDGLSGAREAARVLRARINDQTTLGSGLKITIKRGCSHMEAACGPSDRWTFREELAGVEEQLRLRFQPELPSFIPYPLRRAAAMAEWLQIAYMIGDDTYLTFTNGRRLHRPSVTYSEEP